MSCFPNTGKKFLSPGSFSLINILLVKSEESFKEASRARHTERLLIQEFLVSEGSQFCSGKTYQIVIYSLLWFKPAPTQVFTSWRAQAKKQKNLTVQLFKISTTSNIYSIFILLS